MPFTSVVCGRRVHMSAHFVFDQQDHLASLLRATGVLNYSLAKPCHRHGAFSILAGPGVAPSSEPGKQYKRRTPASPCHGPQASYSSWSTLCIPNHGSNCYHSCTADDDDDACIEEFLLNRENSSKRLQDGSSSALSPVTLPASGCSLSITPLPSLQGHAAAETNLDGQLYGPAGAGQSACGHNTHQTAAHPRQVGASGSVHGPKRICRDSRRHVVGSSSSVMSSDQEPHTHQTLYTSLQTTTGSSMQRTANSTACRVASASQLPSSLVKNLPHPAALSCKAQQHHTYTAVLHNRSKHRLQLALQTTALPRTPGQLAALTGSNAGQVQLQPTAPPASKRHCRSSSGNKVVGAQGPVGIHVDVLPPVQARHKITAAIAAAAAATGERGGNCTHILRCASSTQQQGPVMRRKQHLQHVPDGNGVVGGHDGHVNNSPSHDPKKTLRVTGALSARKAAVLQALDAVTTANHRAAAVLCAAAKRATAAAAAPRQGIALTDNMLSDAAVGMVISWYLAAEGREQQYDHTAGGRHGVHDGDNDAKQQQQQQARHKAMVLAESTVTAELSSSSTWSDVCPSSARCSRGVGYTVLERQHAPSSSTLCSSTPANSGTQDNAWHQQQQQQQQHDRYQESHAGCIQELMRIKGQEKQDGKAMTQMPQAYQSSEKTVRVAVLAGAEPLQEFISVSSIIDQLELGLGDLRLTAKRLSTGGQEELSVPLRQKYAA